MAAGQKVGNDFAAGQKEIAVRNVGIFLTHLLEVALVSLRVYGK